MLHFAYGSNMSAALMRRRCPGARLEGSACLPDYRFIIMRSGYASVVPAPGCCVHGLLWRVTPRDVAALNAYENLDGGLYRAVTMAVVSHRRRRSALVYIGCNRVCGRPRSGYLDIVIEAARDAGFPPPYLRGLARWASAQNSAPRIAHFAGAFFHGDRTLRDQAADDPGRRSENRVSRVDRTEGLAARP
jgi:gamma-glutamylcyclotransferase (GGCT)/AIG2-like uncharacterized protein YtfP